MLKNYAASMRAEGLSLTTLIKGILTFTEDFFSVDSDNLLSLTISFFFVCPLIFSCTTFGIEKEAMLHSNIMLNRNCIVNEYEAIMLNTL